MFSSKHLIALYAWFDADTLSSSLEILPDILARTLRSIQIAGENNALPACFGASISCSMALYMVKYDLKRPLQNYPRLYPAIKACGMAWHAMANMWFVMSSEMSAYKIADRVRLSINEDDKVFVSRLSTDSAWCGLEEKGSDWLKKHM